jgi:outer membrane protein, heavy metal efflux system
MRAMKAFLGLVLLSLSLPAYPAATLRASFDRAWERSAPGRVAEARRGEVAASRSAADSLLAGAPSIGISQRDDRFNTDTGLRERELGVALPLWLPGQRGGRQAVAGREAEEGDAAVEAARLTVAGELRTAVWALVTAQAEVQLARERVETARQLEADVARREAAGDLARTDLLLARQETLAARAAAGDADVRRIQTSERLRLLTGDEVLPTDAEEAEQARMPQRHPRLRLAEAATERARAALDLARDSRRESPELSLGVLQTRDDFLSPTRASLRLGLRIPFASEGRNAPLLAVANTSLVQAEGELRRVQAEVEGELRETAAALAAARLSDELAAERAAAAAERHRLLARSFELGETPLAELLRARAQATEARLDAARAHAALSAAKARVNQARGVVP